MISAVEASKGGLKALPKTATDRASISREQFLRILTTELTSQNPLDPMDNTQFMNQLVSLQTLEQTAALTDGLKSFERFLQMSSAGSLIGKAIKGVAQDGTNVSGTVSKVVVEKDGAFLIVGSAKVPVNGVQEILLK